MWPALTALLLAAAPPPHPVERQLQEISQCMQCCSPGGSCEYAYHQSKGFCCGTMQATAYCCPWPTSEAMCVRCNMGYKCAKAGSARSQSDLQRICADMGGAPSSSRPSYSPSRNSGYRSSPQQDMFGSLVGLLMLGLIVFAIYRCCVAAQQQQEQQMVQMGQTGGPPPAYGQPGYGQPGYGQGYPVQQSTGCARHASHPSF
ncbi:hypothetical protein T492DRAFT_837866 [Pavlovales sp. CCMP2436]|nr:hypothetical protein T492DRAFT_837866 [Pavlovales sp. CCMP2436]